METSAKLKVNVEETFALIVRRVVEARKAAEQQPYGIQEKGGYVETKRPGMGEQDSMDTGCSKCCIIC